MNGDMTHSRVVVLVRVCSRQSSASGRTGVVVVVRVLTGKTGTSSAGTDSSESSAGTSGAMALTDRMLLSLAVTRFGKLVKWLSSRCSRFTRDEGLGGGFGVLVGHCGVCLLVV